MTLSVQDFRHNIVDPTLRHLDLYSLAASNLLVGTALVESKLIHRRQIGGGPARGLFQIEKATFDDVYGRYLRKRQSLLARVNELLMPWRTPWENVEYNDRFSCAIARVRYLYAPEPIPDGYGPEAISALGAYWLKHYNAGGKGSVSKFLAAWESAAGRT